MGSQCSSTTHGVPPSPKAPGPKRSVKKVVHATAAVDAGVDAGKGSPKASGPVLRSDELLQAMPPPVPPCAMDSSPEVPICIDDKAPEDPPYDAQIFCSTEGAGRLPVGYDMTHSWIRQANSSTDRSQRRLSANSTRVASQDGGYMLDGQWVKLDSVDRLVSSTRLVRASEASEASKLPSRRSSASVEWSRHEPGQAVRVAVDRATSGQKVALVNASSAYHVGGGFESGGRHALEEAICTQSTLFESLSAFHDNARGADDESPKYIPADGAVLSPGVQVFRGGSDDGYPFLPGTDDGSAARLAAVVSVAMPNRNPRVMDAPVDAPSNQKEYHATLVQRFTAALTAALLAEASVVVVPDLGCGVYGNDPQAVGRALGEVVRRCFPEAFAEIHLVGLPAFVEAALLSRKPAALGGA